MSKKNPPLSKPKKPVKKDWHRKDIIAAICKTGTNLSQLSFSLGYKAGVLLNALHGPAPKYERLIAEHLGKKPQQLWPSRYHDDGTPRSGRGERGLGRYKAKFNGSAKRRNVNLTGAR